MIYPKSILVLFLYATCLFANPFQWTAISEDQIEEWIGQFGVEDQPTARKLLSYIDYYGPDKVNQGLKNLHFQLVEQLRAEGFDLDGEDPYEQVDFTKLYCAKSGDLLSYFYRQINGLRSTSFKNLSDLIHDGKNKGQRALVIIEDYIGTGTQFLWENYAKTNYKLFNQYRKVYFVTLVANLKAIERFKQLKTGQTDDWIDFLENMQQILHNPMTREKIQEVVSRLGQRRLELLCDKEEASLFDRSDIPFVDRENFATLFRRYTLNSYLENLFLTQGSTVFFYNCPNSVPNILWNKKNRPGWKPLFYRYEDLSIYEGSKQIPIAEQTW